MHDPRIDELARQLVRYSTNLKRGEKVLIDLYDVPEEVGIALVREARGRGAVPLVTVNSMRVSRELLKGATNEQYRLIAKAPHGRDARHGCLHCGARQSQHLGME